MRSNGPARFNAVPPALSAPPCHTRSSTRPTPWTDIILVCGKCSRKLDGGYGPDREDTLRSTLNDALRARGKRRAVRIVETKCFGLCPKKAVVAVNASEPSRLLTIPRGSPGRRYPDQPLPPDRTGMLAID